MIERTRPAEKEKARERVEGLAVKYRPRTFQEVVGQPATVHALEKIIDRGSAQSFLFIGPSGCGKTTLARIAASSLGVEQMGLMEIDAATHTGIDDMRRIREPLNYKPFGASDARGIIVDEAHMLSKSAWNSLLKAIEEPTEHVYWFFCTTEPGKVPPTIKTRCASFTLATVSDKLLLKLLDRVCDAERIDPSDAIMDLIIDEAHGSPRQALMNLAVCEGVTDKREAAELLHTVVDRDLVIELCRLLVSKGSWSRGMAIVGEMGEATNPESVRIVVCNYVASCIKGAKGEKDVPRLLNILEAFAIPYNQSEKMAPLYLSMGRIFFGG